MSRTTAPPLEVDAAALTRVMATAIVLTVQACEGDTPPLDETRSILIKSVKMFGIHLTPIEADRILIEQLMNVIATTLEVAVINVPYLCDCDICTLKREKKEDTL